MQGIGIPNGQHGVLHMFVFCFVHLPVVLFSAVLRARRSHIHRVICGGLVCNRSGSHQQTLPLCSPWATSPREEIVYEDVPPNSQYRWHSDVFDECYVMCTR